MLSIFLKDIIFPIGQKKQFYSYKLRVTKSEKESFLKVLKELKIRPEDCILIDDDKNNVRNANELGINGIVFENNKKTFEKINQIISL